MNLQLKADSLKCKKQGIALMSEQLLIIQQLQTQQSHQLNNKSCEK